LRSRRSAFGWLLAKETRELAAAPSWWVLLVAIGPLVGITFINAARTYAEASGLNGTTVGVGEAFSPLVGIWSPTFSACEVAAVFLLPFVAIRLVAGDEQSGALKIEAQHPMPPLARVGVKVVVLVGAWLVASLAPFAAVALWLQYGGHLNVPELASVSLGHLLNAGLTIALACAAAALTEHPSTAAIFTLAVTVGTWVLNFAAAVQGGFWEKAAGYTPPAMIAEFQHGLIRLDAVLISIVFIAAGMTLAAIGLRHGVAARRRVREALVLGAVTAAAVFACTFVKSSWDLSENRMNSFPSADEAALGRIREPLVMEVHLAPEDPRRVDLERRAISKLRRALPKVHVTYESATSIGLFEQTSPHYGEIWYEIGGRRQMSRATTPESALETIYELAGVTPPGDDDDGFGGYPLAIYPHGAATIFYGIWPAVAFAAALIVNRRTR
jgi:hypothetical protein